MPSNHAALWAICAGVLFALAGAVLLAAHALRLQQVVHQVAAPGLSNGALVSAVPALQNALPGVAFSVPTEAGITLQVREGGALLVAAGMQADPAARVDLCQQTAGVNATRLMPLRVGYEFADVTQWVARNRVRGQPDGAGLRNVVLAGGADAATVPQLEIEGPASADFNDLSSQPLQLHWGSRQRRVWLLSDAETPQIQVLTAGQRADAAMRREAWLVWDEAAPAGASGSAATPTLARHALHLQRRVSPACPQAGELLLQLWRMPPAANGIKAARAVNQANPVSTAKALVQAFPLGGAAAQSIRLAAGQYTIPSAPASALEDQILFSGLQQQGLLRLNADGLIELVPRDLASWRASGQIGRAAELASWDAVRLDPVTLKLIKRLYLLADGAYVRQQIQVFNGGRRLLALRLRSALPGLQEADPAVQPGATPASLTAAMPPMASRFFADLPQGWGPWRRLRGGAVDGVATDGAATDGAAAQAQISIALPQPAVGGEAVELLLIGHLQAVQGARIEAARGVCTGRACPDRDAVQHVTLALLPGARTLLLQAQALTLAALPSALPAGDVEFRHIRRKDGRLQWQTPPGFGGREPLTARAGVTLRDRHGALLWANGSATPAAADAGLSTMLGVRAEHGNSVAGVLGRLALPPTAGGTGQTQVAARLSLDLALQTLSQQVLDCVGVRQGRWDGKQCLGGQAAPEQRRAGMVIIDAETGEVLAAAGSGGASEALHDWDSVRDFDRSNPARSPLRLTAWQHDGGAHQSPGSTFKTVSALALEAAAQTDPQLDALLAGAPLAQINRLAAQRGFAFRTDGACYPLPCDAAQAHVTNYKDQQLDRRAQAGRFGLTQAITYSLNTWFAWTGELSDRSLFGLPQGGAPDLLALDGQALDSVRPILGVAHQLGFEQAMHLDGGLLPDNFPWASWDALQTTPSHIDASHTRHELRQMSIGLRMQVTPLQMALVAAAIGQGGVVTPRLLLGLQQDGAERLSQAAPLKPLGMRLDRIRAGMKGVVDQGTAAGAFGTAALQQVRPGLYGKTGTAPAMAQAPDGSALPVNTVWFTGWLEPGSVPGQTHRWALAAFASHSQLTGGAHAAPMVAAVLSALAAAPHAPLGTIDGVSR
jgi:cell division protein FtsI/penicillin-binding protein 2